MATFRNSRGIPSTQTIIMDLFITIIIRSIGLLPISAENDEGTMVMMGQAEKIIQSLQLIPSLQSVHEISPLGFDGYTNVGPSLFERNLDLHISGNSGSSISDEDLGHHAGYFELKGTHASRYDL